MIPLELLLASPKAVQVRFGSQLSIVQSERLEISSK